jgi:hypothetical protein
MNTLKAFGVGKVAQVAEHPPSKREALSSSTDTTTKKKFVI